MTLPTLDPITLHAIVCACVPEDGSIREEELRAIMPEIRATVALDRRITSRVREHAGQERQAA